MSEAVKVRLLICHDCNSVEELPWYEGPPEHDDTLIYRDSFHRYPGGIWHSRILGDVEKAVWDKPSYRDEIVRQIAIAAGKPGTGVGMGQTFYDVKANFGQDAVKCWKQHGRTPNCGDYMSDRKRLLPDTRADRKAEGLDTKHRPSTWLCQFCPVESLVQQRKNKAKGLYD